VSVAIFGGTFDPIHRGHVEIARAAADRFGLEQVLFIPSGHPPHKQNHPEASYEHRFRMVALACGADPRFRPSRLEAPDGGSGPHYSVDTVRRVGDQLVSGERLLFITGSDAFAEVTLWYEWRTVAAAVEFIVVSRPGADFRPGEAPPEIRAHWLGGVELPISSTDIREWLRSGAKTDELLPPHVAAYILEHGLYGKSRAGP
jgi:nicotinate-nucleotide adenylyltransferase